MPGKSYMEDEKNKKQKEQMAALKAKLTQEANAFRKSITGIAAGDKEIKSLEEKFIAEKTGAAVSEEELLLIKSLLPKS